MDIQHTVIYIGYMSRAYITTNANYILDYFSHSNLNIHNLSCTEDLTAHGLCTIFVNSFN